MDMQHQATGTITGKFPPDPGKKMWKIVLDTGQKYLISPTEQQFYNQHETYTFGFTSSEFQGRTYHTIKGRPIGSAPATAAITPPTNGNGSPLPHSYKDLDIATQAVYKASGTLILSRNHEGEITKQMIAEALLLCEDGVKLWWRSRNKAAPTPPPALTNIEDTF